MAFPSLISQDEKNLVFILLKIDYKYTELWEIEGQSGVARKKFFNSISFNENNWKLFGASIKFPFFMQVLVSKKIYLQKKFTNLAVSVTFGMFFSECYEHQLGSQIRLFVSLASSDNIVCFHRGTVTHVGFPPSQSCNCQRLKTHLLKNILLRLVLAQQSIQWNIPRGFLFSSQH